MAAWPEACPCAAREAARLVRDALDVTSTTVPFSVGLGCDPRSWWPFLPRSRGHGTPGRAGPLGTPGHQAAGVVGLERPAQRVRRWSVRHRRAVPGVDRPRPEAGSATVGGGRCDGRLPGGSRRSRSRLPTLRLGGVGYRHSFDNGGVEGRPGSARPFWRTGSDRISASGPGRAELPRWDSGAQEARPGLSRFRQAGTAS